LKFSDNGGLFGNKRGLLGNNSLPFFAFLLSDIMQSLYFIVPCFRKSFEIF
jgi:hypothetical protein